MDTAYVREIIQPQKATGKPSILGIPESFGETLDKYAGVLPGS